MRKIISKKELGKKAKRNQFIVGAILVFIMMFSVLGYSFGGRNQEEETEKIVYGELEFVNQNGFWFTQIGDFEFVFSYNPNEVSKQDVELNYVNNYQDKPLYISSEDYKSSSEIYNNLNQFVLRMQNVCTEEQECEGDLPVKTCEDNFIIIKKSNETKLVQNNSCVFIEAPLEELVKITDEFLFQILGIRK